MNKYDFLVIAFLIGVLIGCIFLGKWLFEVIIASDLPDWVKYMMLK
jgi:uncharacterized membrane protein